MARSLAGDLMQQLYQRGMTNAQISHALGGYDPAILGRVARGERPGTNLVGPLQGLLGGMPSATVPKAEHQKRIIRDAQGRITSYRPKQLSAARLKRVLRQAANQGATRAGMVADVGTFQGYEQRRAGQHLIRAFRKGDSATPGALAQRLDQARQPAETFLLSEIKAATGAEEVADLRGVQINFYYGS
ncbi:MAG TPA: hypothetical protein VH599_18895 [Ktedonobacterales bacterium]|jgi:hypothetical protein